MTKDSKIRPKKSLGQHFLNSSHVLEQIISAAAITKDETVLEIGPGTGILTGALLKADAHVIAIEKDDRAYEMLKEKFSKEIFDGRLRLTHGDILNQDIFNTKNYAIVANIPYYITGAILEKFLEHEPRPNRMVLLVQREVAERIVARPPDGTGHGKESVLSISVKAFGDPKIIARVSRGAFTPVPTVDSAILAIENISGSSLAGKNASAIGRFFEIVRAGFAHKRKLLIRNLETMADREKVAVIWKKFGLDEKVRAEDISVQDWLRIAEHISPNAHGLSSTHNLS